MKKNIFPFLLIVVPYVYAVVFIVYLFGGGLRGEEKPLQGESLFVAYVIMLGVALLCAVITAFVSPHFGTEPAQLARWDMIVKLAHIPFYALAFFLGAGLVWGLLLFGGPILAALLAAICYPLLFISSMFGFGALWLAWRRKLLDRPSTLLYLLCHFIFVLDVLAAVALYRKLKSHTNEKP